MKIIIDISRYQQLVDFELLKKTGQKHVLMKGGSGSLSKDAKFDQHYAGATASQMIPDPYFWHDPIYSATTQSQFFCSLLTGKKFGFTVLDFEQWWADWDKWSQWQKKLIPRSAVPVIPSDKLFNHFVSTYEKLKASCGYEVIIYTADWFLDTYCPQAWDYLHDKWTHWADYSLYSGTRVEKTWEQLDALSPVGKRIPTLPPIYPTDRVLMWQWSGDRFQAPGVYADMQKTRLSDLDLNLWVNHTVSIDDISHLSSGGSVVTIPTPAKEMYTVANKPLQLLNVPYIPQIGEGANEYSNDCGAASGTMLVKAYTEFSPTVDEFYKATGNKIDAYLYQAQIINVLSGYGLGARWMTSNMPALIENLKSGKPVICLILYEVLRDAGLTQSQFAGYHFVTVVGFDTKNIYVHDPLWNNEGGKNLAVPYATFELAWKQAGKDPAKNPSYGCIVPNYAIGQGTGSYSSYKVTATRLNVRSTPDSSVTNNVIGSLAYGTIVQVSTISNGWGKLYGRDGYIFMSYAIRV